MARTDPEGFWDEGGWDAYLGDGGGGGSGSEDSEESESDEAFSDAASDEESSVGNGHRPAWPSALCVALAVHNDSDALAVHNDERWCREHIGSV